MIKNDRDYRRTTSQATQLRRAVAEGQRTRALPGVAQELHIALLDITRSQLADLERELAEYRRHHRHPRPPVWLVHHQ